MGAKRILIIEHDLALRKLLGQKLKEEGFHIVSLEQTAESIPLQEFEPIYPLCLLLGNEIKGVRDDLLLMSDAVISIPMLGQKESLNVAVAAGIALHTLRFPVSNHTATLPQTSRAYG